LTIIYNTQTDPVRKAEAGDIAYFDYGPRLTSESDSCMEL